VTLVWVTGSPGAGKSAACALLRSLGETAVDADWEGFSQWTDRVSGRVVTDPPYPVPPGWLGRFAWKINRSKVETLARRARNGTAFLFGSVENEIEVWDLFDLVICLVVDDETLRERLRTRTTNHFGKDPAELSATLERNAGVESTYRGFGATILDGRQPLTEVVEAILAAAHRARTTDPHRSE
jgi:dephospho-CoA kinase